MLLIVFLSGWLIGFFDGLVTGWWWVHGTGGGNIQKEQTSPCSLCPYSGSSGIKQQKWDTASQGGQVSSCIDHWWRCSKHAAKNHPPKIWCGKTRRRRELPSESQYKHHKFIILSSQVNQNRSSRLYVETIISCERGLKRWHIKIHADSPNGSMHVSESQQELAVASLLSSTSAWLRSSLCLAVGVTETCRTISGAAHELLYHSHVFELWLHHRWHLARHYCAHGLRFL